MENFELIGVRVISHALLYESLSNKRIPFAIHYGRIIKRPEPHHNLITACNGAIEVHERTSVDIVAVCNSCASRMELGHNWFEAISECMQIAFEAAIYFLQFLPSVTETPPKDHIWHSQIARGLNVCFPECLPTSKTDRGTIRALIGYEPFWWDVWNRFHDSAVPIRKGFGIATIHVLELEKPETLSNLLVNSAFLMQRMEQKFQLAIRKFADQACSASADYHAHSHRAIR